MRGNRGIECERENEQIQRKCKYQRWEGELHRGCRSIGERNFDKFILSDNSPVQFRTLFLVFRFAPLSSRAVRVPAFPT